MVLVIQKFDLGSVSVFVLCAYTEKYCMVWTYDAEISVMSLTKHERTAGLKL